MSEFLSPNVALPPFRQWSLPSPLYLPLTIEQAPEKKCEKANEQHLANSGRGLNSAVTPMKGQVNQESLKCEKRYAYPIIITSFALFSKTSPITQKAIVKFDLRVCT
jgi:hypothetical protein